MRIQLILFLIVLSTVFGCARQIKQQAPSADLLILHTNDTHSYFAGIDSHGLPCMDDKNCIGGYARIAHAILDAKKRGENVLALDAGDIFQGTLFYTLHRERIFEELNKIMPWDAVTFGNHEWDDGCAVLGKYLSNSYPFAFLAANLKPEGNCPLLHKSFADYIVREIGGQKVGVIGLANDEVLIDSKACAQTKFADQIESVNKAVQALSEQGVQRIVLLTHLGLPKDRILARSVDGVDVIVGGHSHSYLGPAPSDGPYPIVEKSKSGQPVLVVTAKNATKYIGYLSCNFDEHGVLRNWSGELKKLDPSCQREEAVSKVVQKYAKTLQPLLEKKIAQLNVNLGEDGLDACRRKECVTGMVMADAMATGGQNSQG